MSEPLMPNIERVLSGIRPTGDLHLGNYFGAIKQFVELQEGDNECFFFVADLHTLTTALEDEIDIDKNSIEVVRLYIACGIDPNKALIYRQSSIPAIPYLSIILSMVAPEGELRRCVTYKEKVKDMEEKRKLISLGLLAYPVLMAADILFAEADVIPVGEDQLQHLEITREIASRYNNYFAKKKKLKLPKPHSLTPIRVPGLTGEGKMSKSVGGEDSVISMLENPKEIKRKVMSAKTDTGPTEGQEMSESIKNLYCLMELCSSKKTFNEYMEMYKNGEQKFYGKLKSQLADDIITLLEPIQERYYNSDECSEENVIQLLHENAEKVNPIARRTLKAIQSDLGFMHLAMM